LGKYPFISMSIDDLFVLKRFLPSTGMLFHYLDVRQHVAGIRDAMMFDEQDHLGAYVSRNRFDQDMVEQLKKADRVMWDGFSDNVSSYFSRNDWQDAPIPQQSFPAELADILSGLNSFRPRGWLEFDAHLRDLRGESRENFASLVRELLPSLKRYNVRSFLFDGYAPLQIFLHTADYTVPATEITHRSEVACLITQKPEVLVVVLGFAEDQVSSVRLAKVQSPPIIRADYAALFSEADTKRKTYRALGVTKARESKEKLSKRARRRIRHKK
jgi:hypothetical protein